MERKVKILVNPVSQNGNTRLEWPEIHVRLQEAGLKGDVELSQYRGHLTELARKALWEGYDTLVAVGGDGTIHEVLNGFYWNEEKINPDARIAILPKGTGSDFVRSLDVSDSYESFVKKLYEEGDFLADCGKMTDREGKVTYFLNSADVGLGAVTCEKVNQRDKSKGGKSTFLKAALESIVTHKGKSFRITVDGEMVYEGKSSLILVGNGRYFGGSIMINPLGKLNDGFFEVLYEKGMHKIDILKLLFKAYDGKHMGHPRVELHRGKKVVIECALPEVIETDGEVTGKVNATFELLEKAIRIIA